MFKIVRIMLFADPGLLAGETFVGQAPAGFVGESIPFVIEPGESVGIVNTNDGGQPTITTYTVPSSGAWVPDENQPEPGTVLVVASCDAPESQKGGIAVLLEDCTFMPHVSLSLLDIAIESRIKNMIIGLFNEARITVPLG